MTRTQFRHDLTKLGLSLTEFAAITGTTLATSSLWGSIRNGKLQMAPPWVPLLAAAGLGTWAPPLLLRLEEADHLFRRVNDHFAGPGKG